MQSLLGKHTGFKVGLAFGGTDYEKQRNTLAAGVDLLIGTPGRIIDYYKQGVFKLDQVQVAILDEADRMFDLGFIKDIRYLLAPTAATGQASQHVVLGDAVPARNGTRLRTHE